MAHEILAAGPDRFLARVRLGLRPVRDGEPVTWFVVLQLAFDLLIAWLLYRNLLSPRIVGEAIARLMKTDVILGRRLSDLEIDLEDEEFLK